MIKLLSISKLTILLLTVVLFSSCGDDDTTTNPQTPSGTVLYSADSMSVWITTSFGEGSDSVSKTISTPTAIKVEFTVQSNADSTHALGYYFFNTNSSPAQPYEPNILSPVDKPVSLTFNTNPLSTYFNFSIRLIVSSGSIPYFVKLKNIKVTKL